MLKTPMAATAMALALLTAPALAQTERQPPASTMPQAGMVDAQKLIGRSVTNGQNEVVGEIESVILGSDGEVRTAIIGVGGFLGIGARNIAIDWNRLTVSPDGRKVVTAATRDELMAMPPYIYAAAKQRRTAFVETPMSGGAAPSTLIPGDMPVATTGPLSGSDLIGLNVRDAANETVGEIEDFVVSADGRIRSVVVGVGGLLGVGERHVALPWEQLTFGRSDDNSVVARVSATKDQLMSMPAMKRDKNIWIRG